MLVLYYCIKNYHKFISLKQYTFIISRFLRVRSLSLAQLDLLQGHKTVSKVLARARASFEATEKGSTSRFLWLFVEFRSLRVVGLRASFLHWPFSRSHFSSLLHGSLLWPLASSECTYPNESAGKMEIKVLCSLIMEMTAYHLCHILLVTSNSQVLSHKVITQGSKYKRGLLGVILESVHHKMGNDYLKSHGQ